MGCWVLCVGGGGGGGGLGGDKQKNESLLSRIGHATDPGRTEVAFGGDREWGGGVRVKTERVMLKARAA